MGGPGGSAEELLTGALLVNPEDQVTVGLWEQAIKVIPLRQIAGLTDTAGTPVAATRLIDLVLDRISVFSNDTAAYIADPQYRDLAEDYQDLADAARALGEELSRVDEPDQPALRRLEQDLADIGVERT